MRLNEHKRHKMGQLPGDIMIRDKIDLLEGRRLRGMDEPGKWSIGSSIHRRAFRRAIIWRRQYQQRMRDKEVVWQELQELDR